jgi:GrpB-like predicted nucleotidyltransferase (UPF0157 family)
MVEIVPYQPGWPEEFRVLAAGLRQALGTMALRIDHIGSTSIPGMAAKDIIDIQVTVAVLDEPLRKAMNSIGYEQREARTDHRPPNAPGADSEWTKWLFRPAADQRRVYVHIRVQGAANQRYALLFRDYLRTHADSAQAYAELKRRLAQNLADPKTYPDVKDPAVDLIYFAAEAWAAATKWQPGPTDA